MQTSVTFKNIEPSEHLKSYVGDKLNRFDKYLYNPAEANVVLSVEINGKEETDDMYSAIDMVLDKLEKQIKKNKQKIREHRTGLKPWTQNMIDEDAAFTEDEDTGGILVRNIEYKPMDVEEAVMQMGLVTDNFLVFTNARTDKVNVLYRRKDGDYGLIQPNT